MWPFSTSSIADLLIDQIKKKVSFKRWKDDGQDKKKVVAASADYDENELPDFQTKLKMGSHDHWNSKKKCSD